MAFVCLSSIGASGLKTPGEEAADLPPLEEENATSRSKHTGHEPHEVPPDDEAAAAAGGPGVLEQASEGNSHVEADSGIASQSIPMGSMGRQPTPTAKPTILFKSSSMIVGATFAGATPGRGQQAAATTPLTGPGAEAGLPFTDTRRRSINTFLSPENTPGMIDGREDFAQLSSNTWAGDTAQVNARRLRALLSAKTQSNIQATPSLNKAPSMFLREESFIDPEQLLPGERRFLELRWAFRH